MKKSFLLILIVFSCFLTNIYLYSQVRTDEKSKLSLIKEVKEYCEENLLMNLPETFYSQWSENEIPYNYLYVSQSNSIKPVFIKGFGKNENKAQKQESYYANLGYSTLRYKTYGNSKTQLSKSLIAYSEESLTFIIFHEATHLFVRAHGKVPYKIEEAMCDLIGNYASLEFNNQVNLMPKRKVKKQLKRIEYFAREINTSHKLVTEGNLSKYEKNKRKIRRRLKKLSIKESKFLFDRYDYEINNAFILRNINYTQYYFKLKKLMECFNDLSKFLNFISNLPAEEEECLKIINAKIADNTIR